MASFILAAGRPLPAHSTAATPVPAPTNLVKQMRRKWFPPRVNTRMILRNECAQGGRVSRAPRPAKNGFDVLTLAPETLDTGENLGRGAASRCRRSLAPHPDDRAVHAKPNAVGSFVLGGTVTACSLVGMPRTLGQQECLRHPKQAHKLAFPSGRIGPCSSESRSFHQHLGRLPPDKRLSKT